MPTILSVATDDPTNATLALATAVGALGAEKRAQLAFLGEGAYLVTPTVAKNVHGVGFPPLEELMAMLVGAGVEIFV